MKSRGVEGRQFVGDGCAGVIQVQKEFASQVEKSPEVAESMARLDEAEDKVLEVFAQILEKATEVVGETCMSGASRYLRELERRNSARAATTEKHKAERERERDEQGGLLSGDISPRLTSGSPRRIPRVNGYARTRRTR